MDKDFLKNTKSPQRPPMCQTIFFSRQTQCESTEYLYFGAYATTMTSKCLSIQSVAPSATAWPELKGNFLRSAILGVRECQGVCICTNRKPTHDHNTHHGRQTEGSEQATYAA